MEEGDDARFLTIPFLCALCAFVVNLRIGRAASRLHPEVPMLRMALLVVVPLLLCACAAGGSRPKPRWAIAIHGGAGTISHGDSPERAREYEAGLRRALDAGREALESGASALDTAERVVRILEDDPLFNAGKGAVYTEKGTHELDASIMDGRTLACGAVAGVTTVKNPITLARKVMENTRHVLLAGAGAEAFADEVGVERVPNTYFDTPQRFESLQKVLRERESKRSSRDQQPKDKYGTVGCVVLDTPVIGAGCYASNRSCAVSCTGTGEEFIRHGVARDIAAIYEYKGLGLEEATRQVVHGKLKPDDGGVIAVSKDGEIVLMFNTEGMYRAWADSIGARGVAIWEGKQ
jgi:L-asparaginase / beta-aspartyl-peptidase